MFSGAIGAGTGLLFTEIPDEVMFPITVTAITSLTTGTVKAIEGTVAPPANAVPTALVGPCTRFPIAMINWVAMILIARIGPPAVGLEGSSRKHWLLLKTHCWVVICATPGELLPNDSNKLPWMLAV